MEGRKFNFGDYRFGFNGKEADTQGEWGSATHYDYGVRVYNPSIGRFLSIDPLAHEFPEESSYVYAGNSPIMLIDANGEFKFDPQTLEILRNQYPTAYKYLVEAKIIQPGNILELTTSDVIVNNMIKNTQFHHATLTVEKAQRGEITLGLEHRNQLDILRNGDVYRLTKEDIVEAFTSGKGPLIEISDAPAGFVSANGYNQHEDGKAYNTPIVLNRGLFEALENASEDDKQAALLNLTSVLLHEYLEDFANDTEDYGHGEFGARVFQWQTYENESPGFHNLFGEIDQFFEVAKSVIEKMQEGGSNPNPEVLPTVPKQ